MAAQDAADGVAFGPVKSSESTKFRVTSLHKGDGKDPGAFAVCKGRVRLQQDDNDSSLLNLVLAPDVVALRGVPIRYFVYRGIRKDSLISSGALVNEPAKNELVPRLLADSDATNDAPDALGLAFRSASDSPPSPDYAREDGDPVDSIFYETTTLKGIPVNAGDRLGSFSGALFGFEILVGTAWEPPTLKLLRKPPISTGNVLEIASADSLAQARAKRERVLGYLDPCAFYGMCFELGVRYKIGQNVFTAGDSQELFDKVLSKFLNQSKVYLDIRNDNGLSFDYYDSYGGKVLLGLDQNELKDRRDDNKPLEPVDPLVPGVPYDTHGWPLKILDASSFTNLTNEKAAVRLSLPTGEDATASPRRDLFLEFARLYYKANGRNKKSLLVDPVADDRLPEISPKQSAWTRQVILAVPTAKVGNAKVPIAFCARLRYLRPNEPQPSTAGRYISTAGQWDNLFALDVNPALWVNDNLCSWWLRGHIKYLIPEAGQVYHGFAETGIAVDRDAVTHTDARITLFYLPIHVIAEPQAYRVPSGNNVSGTGGSLTVPNSFFQRKESKDLYDASRNLKLIKASEYKSDNPDPFDISLAVPPANLSSYLTFLTLVENPAASDALAPKNHVKEGICAMSFTAAEYAAMVAHVASEGFDPALHPVFLQVRARTFPRETDTATERAYQAIELRLAGYDGDGKLKFFDIPSTGAEGIRLLSLYADGMIFCTDGAARFEPQPVRWNYNEICSVKDPIGDDGELFRTALVEIKRYHPQFYGRMERLQLLGEDVIFHDAPFDKQRRFYRIEVTFDPTFTKASGDTAPQPTRYKGVFKDHGFMGSTADLDVMGILVSGGDSTYGGVNETRYVALNRERKWTPSQVNALFLTDYTRGELDASPNGFDQNKLYLRSKWKPGGKGAFNVPMRITLAELKQLGAGALDPKAVIPIRINRQSVQDEPTMFVQKAPPGFKDAEVPKYNPRQWSVTGTLAHELGHAELLIAEPLVDYIWGELEGIFDTPVVNKTNANTVVITAKRNPDIHNTYSNFHLATPYPNPRDGSNQLRISTKLSQALNDALDQAGFLAPIGEGHLRGAPTAQNACTVERFINEQVHPMFNREIAKQVPTHKKAIKRQTSSGFETIDIDEPDYPAVIREFSVAYCFLNQDDSDLSG